MLRQPQQQQHSPRQQQPQPLSSAVAADSPGSITLGSTGPPARRKGLTNKKIEKPGTTLVAAEASVAPMWPVPTANAATAPAAATTPPTAQASSGQDILATQPSPTNSIGGGSGGGGGGAGTLPKCPALMGSSQSTMLASSIKALNLEPANPHRVRSKLLRPPVLDAGTAAAAVRGLAVITQTTGGAGGTAAASPLATTASSVGIGTASDATLATTTQTAATNDAAASITTAEEAACADKAAAYPTVTAKAAAASAATAILTIAAEAKPALAGSKRPKHSGSKLVNKKLAKVTEASKDKNLGVSKPSLKPVDGIYDKTLMLRIWRNTTVTHPQVLGLHTQPRATPALPTQAQILERRVRGLLNKICPDNLQVITEQLAAIELQNVEQLETIIKLIFGIALTDPHYCETYADMVFTLKSCYPEFPAEREGEKTVTFARAPTLRTRCKGGKRRCLQT